MTDNDHKMCYRYKVLSRKLLSAAKSIPWSKAVELMGDVPVNDEIGRRLRKFVAGNTSKKPYFTKKLQDLNATPCRWSQVSKRAWLTDLGRVDYNLDLPSQVNTASTQTLTCTLTLTLILTCTPTLTLTRTLTG